MRTGWGGCCPTIMDCMDVSPFIAGRCLGHSTRQARRQVGDKHAPRNYLWDTGPDRQRDKRGASKEQQGRQAAKQARNKLKFTLPDDISVAAGDKLGDKQETNEETSSRSRTKCSGQRARHKVGSRTKSEG